MQRYHVALLPGDGIGPEVMGEVERLCAFLRREGLVDLTLECAAVGGASLDATGKPISEETYALAKQADAVFLGAVGGPKWESVPYALRPEAALLGLRKRLDLFSNVRPALCYPALASASSLKPERVSGLDLVIVRELTGGVYFGEPKEIVTLESGVRRAVDSQVYTSVEIERIAKSAFALAEKRGKRVVSVEKRNVMVTGVLWHEVVQRVHANGNGHLELSSMLADNCAMQLVRDPLQFDVILTDNLFGDVLSDLAAMLTGSLGMLPSASLGAADAHGRFAALYEPVHGSAPDIAGMGKANPIASIASLSMALRYSFGAPALADALDRAIGRVLEHGARTADIASGDESADVISTREMGERIEKSLGEVLSS